MKQNRRREKEKMRAALIYLLQHGDKEVRAIGGDTKVTRKDMAASAGLSKRQHDIALRVANVPQDEFERAVESDTPPTEKFERNRTRGR
jgi:hypothetical protein